MEWLKRYAKTIIVLVLIAGSIISMIQLKSAYEVQRHSRLVDRFMYAQLVLILTLAYVVFTFLFNKWKEYRALKDSHAQAQLELLKSKMDPHFFFNTLNNLYGLAIEKSEDTAPIILKLSEVMRYTIYNGSKEQVPLKDEIEHLKQYIEIHKIRYNQAVDIEFKEDLSDDAVSIAPLLFINLLENAFKHGAETLTKGAYIRIQIKSTDKAVSFEIENNKILNQGQKEGIGLKNLQQRLKLTYPKKHTLELKPTDLTYTAKLELIVK